MKTLVLVFAMAQERDASLDALTRHFPAQKVREHYHIVETPSLKLHLLHTGVTMLNAYKLAELLTTLSVDEVINVGTCAGLRNLAIGDVIHSRTFYHHEIDLSFFPTSLALLQVTNKEAYHRHPVLVSGNTFISDKEEVRKVIEKFDADAFDMESFGYYTICKEKNIPFSAIRGVTDDGQTHAEHSFESNLKLASIAAAKVMLQYIGIE